MAHRWQIIDGFFVAVMISGRLAGRVDRLTSQGIRLLDGV